MFASDKKQDRSQKQGNLRDQQMEQNFSGKKLKVIDVDKDKLMEELQFSQKDVVV